MSCVGFTIFRLRPARLHNKTLRSGPLCWQGDVDAAGEEFKICRDLGDRDSVWVEQDLGVSLCEDTQFRLHSNRTPQGSQPFFFAVGGGRGPLFFETRPFCFNQPCSLVGEPPLHFAFNFHTTQPNGNSSKFVTKR